MSEGPVDPARVQRLENRVDVLRARIDEIRGTVLRERLLPPMALMVAGFFAPWCWLHASFTDSDTGDNAAFHTALGLLGLNEHGDHRMAKAMAPVLVLTVVTVVLWLRALYRGRPPRSVLATFAGLLGVAALIATLVLRTETYDGPDADVSVHVHLVWVGPALFVVGAWLLAVQSVRDTLDF